MSTRAIFHEIYEKKFDQFKNVLLLRILTAIFLADELIHILQKDEIGPKIAKITRVAATYKENHVFTIYLQFKSNSFSFYRVKISV